MSTNLRTVDSVVTALGGRHTVSAMASVTYEAVCNWARWGRFPAKTFVGFQELLTAKGYRAPARLWGMIEMKRCR